jgi:hypothetical protein
MTEYHRRSVPPQILPTLLLKQWYVIYGTVTVNCIYITTSFFPCLNLVSCHVNARWFYWHCCSQTKTVVYNLFKYQHPSHYHLNISLNTIVRMLRKISGILITVRIDRTRFNTCDLTDGCSPKPWMFWFAPQPMRLSTIMSLGINSIK